MMLDGPYKKCRKRFNWELLAVLIGSSYVTYHIIKYALLLIKRAVI